MSVLVSVTQVSDCAIKIQGLKLYNYCKYVHRFIQFLAIYFSLQVKIKPNDGVLNCTYIHELGVVTNRYVNIFIER
jgi:hypothetical protein